MPHDTYQSYHRFSAITFDTSSCRDDYRSRLAVMTKRLQSLTPDILLLQNVFATADNRFNTAAHLARQLHMQCAFLPMRPKVRHLDGRPIESHSGLAILSRHPIIDAGHIELPRDPRDGRRLAQFADIVIEGTHLLIANIQLGHLAGTDAARRHQIEKLAECLADAHDFDHILAGGDFNAGRIEPALDPIRTVQGFTVAEAAPERGVDRLFAMTRTASYRPVPPVVLTESRAELDAADAATNLYPGDRAALACELTLSAALPANVIPATDLSTWANRPQTLPHRAQIPAESRVSPLQTAAE
jgi:endonuclease/exonuclease/phosphatase family metal-dependent hydrolase